MNVESAKLNLPGNNNLDVLNVKCPPELIGRMRQEKGFLPAYHMNKEHWLTILLDGTVSKNQIKELIAISYDLTL